MGRDYISAIVAAKEAFSSGKTKDVKFRKQQLQKLFKCVRDNEVRWCEALKKDLNKSKTEAVSAEIILVNNEIVTAIKNLDQWVKNEPKKKELATITADIYTRKEPFGTCLIMSAWNYPFLLMLAPMIGAIAAGNCVVIKPSECAAHTAKLLQELLPQYIDPTCYPVIVLDAKDSADLVTNNRFDFIFFTGGTAIGRIVMKAAAEYLTPVVLELGGKNPCFVDDSCDIRNTARRICWGRFLNTGQLCLCPDYVLCSQGVRDKFVEEIKLALKEFYGSDPKHSPDYGRIINERQTLRLKKVIESGAGKIVVGGEVDVKERYVAPTVVTDIPADSAYMQQEMFGPILLVVTVKDMDEAIAVVNSREKPLAMYIFAKNKKLVNKILSNTSSGGVTVNDVVMHYVPHSLPFGGVGESGMGAYHGKHTFDTFSHRRSCLVDGNPEFFNSLRYPPHSQKKLSIIRLVLMKNMQKPGFVAFLQSLVGLALFGVLIACAVRLFVQL
nr:fatty aldehyde dehydrogenase-like isoform X1 [Ciona intestinalis]|eukprot:XP_002124149.3 fatty aldehyde dehydrogenase-like isoform X1 [Ciona intestinalis]